MNKFFLFVLILLTGAIGGILANQFLVPFLAHTSPFNKISWLKEAGDGTTIINKTEQITVTEETAVENAVAQIGPSVVGVVAKNKGLTKKTGQSSVYETGFIVTSDGMILTDNAALSDKIYDFIVIKDGQSFPATVSKKDSATGLVLLKINQTNLPVVSFADFNSLRLGQRIILSGVDASVAPAERFVGLGIIKKLGDKNFNVDIGSEDQKATGSPLTSPGGEVIGMAQVGADGIIKAITADVIKGFLGK